MNRSGESGLGFLLTAFGPAEAGGFSAAARRPASRRADGEDHCAEGEPRDKRGEQRDDRDRIAGGTGRLGDREPYQRVSGGRGVGEGESPGSGRDREPAVDRDQPDLNQGHENRVAAERAGHEAYGPARHGEIRQSRDRGYAEFDRDRRDERGRQRGTGEQPVQDHRAEHDPADDADPERRLGQRVQVNLGGGVRADQPACGGRQEVPRMHGIRVDATGHPLACQPAPDGYRDGQGHDHQHAPGGRGVLGQRGGQQHRGEGGSRNERRQNRVAEVGQDDPGALGQVRAGQDQPEGGGQDVKRAGNRLWSPEHRHGRMPCLREPGDAQGDAEQIRRNPRARELVPPWALVFLRDLGYGHYQRHPVLARGRAGVSIRRRAPRAGRYHRIRFL